ncbi:MAG: outer membrane beta-barrel protein [Opitutales bacterium]
MNTPKNQSFLARGGRLLSAGVGVCAIAFSSQALGFYEIARGELLLNTSLLGEYDTNVFGDDRELDDFIFTGTPELQYLREPGLTLMDLRAGVAVRRFDDHSSEDSEDPYVSLSLFFPTEADTRTSYNLDLSYRRVSQVNRDVATRTRSDNYDIGGGVRYNYSPKFGVRGRASFSRRDFRTRPFSDIDTYLAGIDGIYIYSPKLETFLGYTYRRTETARVTRNVDSNTHTVSVGATGQVLPKVEANASVGVAHREFSASDLSSETLLAASGSLVWAALERTTLTLDVSRDFDTSPDDQSKKQTYAGLTLNQQLTEKAALSPFISFTHVDYTGRAVSRTDDVWSLGSNLSYTFTPRASSVLRYSYTNSDSDLATSDHERQIVSLSFLFTF